MGSGEVHTWGYRPGVGATKSTLVGIQGLSATKRPLRAMPDPPKGGTGIALQVILVALRPPALKGSQWHRPPVGTPHVHPSPEPLQSWPLGAGR